MCPSSFLSTILFRCRDSINVEDSNISIFKNM